MEGEGELLAMKVMRKAQIIRQQQVAHIQQERRILQEMGKHPFIITLEYQTDRLSNLDCIIVYGLFPYNP